MSASLDNLNHLHLLNIEPICVVISACQIVWKHPCVSSSKCDVCRLRRAPYIKARAAYILPITSTQWNVHSKH